MNRPSKPALAIVSAVLLSAGSAAAQAVTTRTALNAILGPTRTDEDFSAYTSFFAGGAGIVGPILDHTTVLGIQGPGLVEFGATYRGVGGDLLWPTTGYGNLTSNGLSTSVFQTARLTTTYAEPVVAAGFDVLFAQQLFGALDGRVDFRDGNGGLLGSTSVTATAPNQRIFVGWTSATGIGSVEIVGSNPIHPPVIDDHVYGIDQAEVARESEFGEGCYREFASFYEATNSFDLAFRSLSFLNGGSNYVVTVGNDPLVPPTAAPTPVGNNQVIPFPLGWALPIPGGSTTDVFVSTNGFVRLAPSTDPFLSQFFAAGPVISAIGDDLGVTGSASVILETDPVAQTATVTFDQVRYRFGPSGTLTFQYEFDASGAITIRYGSCPPGGAWIGWSPGQGNNDPGSIDISALGIITPSERDLVPPALSASDRPVLGTTVNLMLADIPAGSLFAARWFGLGALPAPVDLAGIGMPGCLRHVAIDAVALTVNPANPSGYPLALPNDLGLAGVRLEVQGAVLDPAGGYNALGAIVSNAVALTLNRL